MSQLETNPSEKVFVAIDVAKHEHFVLIGYPDGSKKQLRVKNRREDLIAFRDQLKAQPYPVLVGLEPTCSFHRNLSYFLKTEGFEVCGISTLVMARTREALHNSWDKNDPKDAGVILYLLKNGFTQTLSEPALLGHNHLQELSKTHFQVVRRKTKLQHSILNHYLPIYFPEAHVFFKGSRTRWFSRLMKHFPTPSTILQYKTVEEFVEVADPIIGRVPFKFSVLKDFYEVAKNSIGIPTTADSYEVKMFRYAVEEHHRLIDDLKRLEIQIEELLHENADYKILRSVPGIGPLIALTILSEAGDLRRFGRLNQFLKYCGLNLSTEQSGQSRGESKLSKRGNAHLRCVFWQAARCCIETVKKDNPVRDKYIRYTKRAPENADSRRKARTACAAKVATIVFSLIRKGERYRSQKTAPDNLDGRTRGVMDVEALTS